MRHRVGASGAASFWAVAALVASGLSLAAGGFAPALAYSGAQAEAQSDPVSDPYGFPNIKLCCEQKKKKYRKRRHHDDYDYPDTDPDPDYDGTDGPFASVAASRGGIRSRRSKKRSRNWAKAGGSGFGRGLRAISRGFRSTRR
jgi:hypothetical protein